VCKEFENELLGEMEDEYGEVIYRTSDLFSKDFFNEIKILMENKDRNNE
jgi:hypothetical protein